MVFHLVLFADASVAPDAGRSDVHFAVRFLGLVLGCHPLALAGARELRAALQEWSFLRPVLRRRVGCQAVVDEFSVALPAVRAQAAGRELVAA
jgi:hypothetical protein